MDTEDAGDNELAIDDVTTESVGAGFEVAELALP